MGELLLLFGQLVNLGAQTVKLLLGGLLALQGEAGQVLAPRRDGVIKAIVRP